MGDAIYTNMLLLGLRLADGPGRRFQPQRWIQAIELNGTAVEANRALDWLGGPPSSRTGSPPAGPLAGRPPGQSRWRADRAPGAHLTAYQDARLAARYQTRSQPAYKGLATSALTLLVADRYARGCWRPRTKDQVALPITRRRFRRRLKEQLAARKSGLHRFSCCPPCGPKPGPDGRPRKQTFGPWVALPAGSACGQGTPRAG